MVLPQPNMSPGSQQWAATLESLTKTTESLLRVSDDELKAMSKSQTATLQLLSEQITNLNEQVMILPLVQTYSISADVAGFATTGVNNFGTLLSDVVPFPAGKTTADVLAFGVIDLDDYTGGTNYYYTRLGINGSYDRASTIGTSGSGGMSGVSCARVVAGPSFTVTAQASGSAGAAIGASDIYITVIASFQ